MNQKGLALTLILIVVFLLVLTGGGAYYLMQKNSVIPSSQQSITQNVVNTIQPTPSITQAPTATITPSAAPIDTSSWKTYVDSQFGYSIKYPPDYIFQDFSKDSNMLQDLCLVYKQSEGGCIIRIDLRQEKINEHIAKLDGGKDYKIVVSDYNFNSQKAKWVEYRALNNNAIIKYNTITFVDFLLQKDQYLFDLYANGWGSPYDNIFKSMLSTLKFTNQ